MRETNITFHDETRKLNEEKPRRNGERFPASDENWLTVVLSVKILRVKETGSHLS